MLGLGTLLVAWGESQSLQWCIPTAEHHRSPAKPCWPWLYKFNNIVMLNGLMVRSSDCAILEDLDTSTCSQQARSLHQALLARWRGQPPHPGRRVHALTLFCPCGTTCFLFFFSHVLR